MRYKTQKLTPESPQILSRIKLEASFNTTVFFQYTIPSNSKRSLHRTERTISFRCVPQITIQSGFSSLLQLCLLLGDILSNTQAPAANREEPQRHKSEANENIEGDNIMLDIAQRNILDYVDAPASVYGNEGELCDVNVENNIENISNDHNVITHNAKNDDESLHDQLKEQERQ